MDSPARLHTSTLGALPVAALAASLMTSLVVLAGAALAADAPTGQPLGQPAAGHAASPEAAIPFAEHGGVNNWETDGSRGLWVESSRHTWYYGTFATPCFGMNSAETIRFRFSPNGSLDRYSSIATRDSGGECWFKSFTQSAGPPGEHKADEVKPEKPRAAAMQPAAPAAPTAPAP